MAILVLAGLVQAVCGYVAVRRFRGGLRDAAPIGQAPGGPWPAVTVLKPLCGDEPLLEAALASVCAQDYPAFQLVLGVQHAADPALAVVARLQARFPGCDIAVVVDPRPHGCNRKISNLINMFSAARHDVMVIADSDVHCPPDYLRRMVSALSVPGTGLATVVYGGVAPGRAGGSLAGALGASTLNHHFLPGALMARWLGRQDCLGASMALTRETLAAAGGLAALADHLADDHVLGRLVRGLGLQVRVADTLVTTTVPETSLRALFRHELRWCRTVLSVEPLGFALSSVQYPLAWAGLAVLLSGGAGWAGMLFLIAWAVRAGAALGVDRCLACDKTMLATPVSIWLLPLRDLMSVITMLASYCGDRVEWRGQVMHTGGAASAPGSRSSSPHHVPASRESIAS